MEDLITLVSDKDEVIGYGPKMEVHIQEKLHRAFSLFIVNMKNNTVLLHKRAHGKYHSGGLWTNSCCSHQREGEELREAVIRRMKEELGIVLFEKESMDIEYEKIDQNLRELGKFTYYKKFDDCAEHEIDHVFFLPIVEHELELSYDTTEMEEVQWIPIEELVHWMEKSPEDFTAWFKPAFEFVCNEIK